MKDIFTGDIFEKIEPPHDVSFKIVGTALPTNQDMYFVAKWHEIFERYTSARLFVRKALEDNWDYWFNKMEDEKVQCAIEYKFKAELYGIDMNAKGHHSKLIDEIPDPDIAISMGCDVGCPFIGRPFDDDWGLMDPTGKSDKDFIEVIKEIEDKIIQLKNSL